MESYPSKRKNQGGSSVQTIHCTPNDKNSVLESAEEYSLYYLHKESSPNFRAGQDVLEVGWGDSPEPLNMGHKIDQSNDSVKCKKKLETKESPKSSVPFKRRIIRSSFNFTPNSIVDVSKYVAEVQELSKHIIKELDSQNINISQHEGDKFFVSGQSIEEDINSWPIVKEKSSVKCDSVDFDNSEHSLKHKDSSFDSILQTFIDEEDDWLSQAMLSQDLVKPVHKGSFVKSKSENELALPQYVDMGEKNLQQGKMTNNFRRTSSFDLTKAQNNLNRVKVVNDTKGTSDFSNVVNQYSLQQIEKKRLEAKYRKERREIERKKLEAIKKLEMKKMKTIKT